MNLSPLPNQQKAFHGHEHDLMCPAALDPVVLQTLASCKFVTTSKRSPFLMNDNRPSVYSHQNTKFVLQHREKNPQKTQVIYILSVAHNSAPPF